LKIRRNPKIPKSPAIIRRRLEGSGVCVIGAMAEAIPGIRTKERTESRKKYSFFIGLPSPTNILRILGTD
jgi:hypothetical protein